MMSTIARCVYFWVLLNDACPKHSPIVTMSAPFWSMWVPFIRMSINLSALANWLIKDLVQLPDPVRVQKLLHVFRLVVEHPQESGFCQVIHRKQGLSAAIY